MDKTLKLLRDADIRVNLKKSKFGQKETRYLGHILSIDGIKMDPRQVERITEFPTPQNNKMLHRWLAMANYYRSFIPSFAAITNKLYDIVARTMPKNPNKEEFKLDANDLAAIDTQVGKYFDYRRPKKLFGGGIPGTSQNPKSCFFGGGIKIGFLKKLILGYLGTKS